jgi:TonB family protein
MQDKKKKRRKKSRVVGWAVPALITLCIFAGSAIAVRTMMKTDESKRRRQIQMIKVLEPQEPPKKIEEEQPEPREQEVKQVVQEIAQEQFVEDNAQQDTNENADEAPAGQDLGLDADGTAGSDGFGLVGKKGGKALVGSSPAGGGSGSSLLGKYGWYIQKVQDKIKEYLRRELEKDGGIPDGNLQATLKIVLSEDGRITDFDIIGSSGNDKMDNAIKTAMKYINIEETLPEGMPKALRIRVSSKG